MPYYGQVQRRLGYRRGRGKYADRRVSKKYAAAVVRKGLSAVAERKWHDTSITAASDGTDNIRQAKSDPINVVPQGSGISSRIGMKHTNLYLNVKLNCAMTSAFSTQYPQGCTIKIWYVLDSASNNGSTSQDDIWHDPNTFKTLSQRNHEEAYRFRMLKEAEMRMSPGAMCPCSMNHYIPLRNVVTQYKDTGGDAAATESNGVWMFWSVYPQSATGSGAVVLTGNSRIVYVDA